MSTRNRFYAKVSKSDYCWEWNASRNEKGYGTLQVGSTINGTRRKEYAHRFSWQMEHGPIPPGAYVLHKCDNPSCVRPSHLFLGTQADNMADMIAKGRVALRRGEKHGRAKISEQDVRDIRAKYMSRQATQQELSDEYGVCQVNISKIVRRELWRHI